ncbi:MAG: nucleotidyl transferase AbiEii/AbiGii toxin family protein [Candidatus Firestonebacteria bacterium]|nr:nucleotidyl transferase AbiEii/AbiGii toxin family protein [Candidatus Firestonebacteria bacterium]
MKGNVRSVAVPVKGLLQSKAKELNTSFAEVLRSFVVERFLYRLSISKYSDKFILKGALMLKVWQIPKRRATSGIDFLALCDKQIYSIENIIKYLCTMNISQDGLLFNRGSVKGSVINAGKENEGVRINLNVSLEKATVLLQVDFWFGDVLHPTAKVLDYPGVLDFSRPHLYGYSVESSISEKFETILRSGAGNNLMKEFYDLRLLMNQYYFDGANLAAALQKTFTQRKTELPEGKQLFSKEIYTEGSDSQKLWSLFLMKERLSGAPKNLAAVAKELDNFLSPPVTSLNKAKEFKKKWNTSGSWE